jgi:hypothetical protein
MKSKMGIQERAGLTADEKRLFQLLCEERYTADLNARISEAEKRGIQIGEERMCRKAVMVIVAERQKSEARLAAAIKSLKAQGVSDDVISRVFGEW